MSLLRRFYEEYGSVHGAAAVPASRKSSVRCARRGTSTAL